jgi:hypothetical protein
MRCFSPDTIFRGNYQLLIRRRLTDIKAQYQYSGKKITLTGIL